VSFVVLVVVVLVVVMVGVGCQWVGGGCAMYFLLRVTEV